MVCEGKRMDLWVSLGLEKGKVEMNGRKKEGRNSQQGG